MIYERGVKIPSKAQLAELRAHADESFCTPASDEFTKGFPNAGLRLGQLPILLKLKKVEEHNDTWVGDWREEPMPHARRCVFWLMESKETIKFTADGQTVEMKAGDWVLFNDDLMHSVEASHRWRGSACQLFIRMEHT